MFGIGEERPGELQIARQTLNGIKFKEGEQEKKKIRKKPRQSSMWKRAKRGRKRERLEIVVNISR